MNAKTMGKRILGAVVLTAVALVVGVQAAYAADSTQTTSMYRLYNPNSGEHFYTAATAERNHLVSVGWHYEGVGWTAPAKSNVAVYRLYNPNAGDHHYTTSAAERDMLKRLGWRYEGVGWYSSETKAVPLYRQYNPNARTGTHNYTVNKAENDMLVRIGWRAEGISWYGVKSSPRPTYNCEYFSLELPENWQGRWTCKKYVDEYRSSMDASNYGYAFMLDGTTKFTVLAKQFNLAGKPYLIGYAKTGESIELHNRSLSTQELEYIKQHLVLYQRA